MANTDIFPPFNLPNEGIPWARTAQDRIIEGEISETQLAQKVDNGLRATSGQLAVLAQQINSLTETILALPVTVSETVRSEGGSLSGSWSTLVQIELPVPTGKTTVALTAIGNAAYLDATTGGATSSYMRLAIGGAVSASFAASKDAGATQVNNVLSGTYSQTLSTSGAVTVALQAYGLNGAAFPARPTNYANLSVLATFS